MLPLSPAFRELFNAPYRDQSHFVQMKARLLMAFALLLLIFVPFNLVKVLWFQPPQIIFRLAFNLDFVLSAIAALYLIRKGRLEMAGNCLVLILIIPIHLSVFFAKTVEPLSAAIQLFSLDLVSMLLSLVFAARWVSFVVLIVTVVSHIVFHYAHLHFAPIAGTMAFAADILLRDGLIATGFIFCLGITLLTLIEGAYRHSEESLRASKAVNAHLGDLVAERTRDLEMATARANQASQAKGDFLANMSHEIRTPLNGILASSELLLHRQDLPAEATDNAQLIAESGELLLKLLGDVLDLSKIEAGQFELESRTFNLRKIVANPVALVSAKAAQGKLEFRSWVDETLGRTFEGDSFRLQQVLLNLLSNAIKFTPAHGRVDLKVFPAQGGVCFEVRDTGIGMDEATRQRIFTRFTQGDSSTSRRYGGTGLGLAISTRIVEMMGGRLEVDSAPDQGSAFHFCLPLCEVKDPIDDSAFSKPSTAPLGLRVLIVEDNAINRKIVMAQLAKLGCESTTAVDGEDALAMLLSQPLPDAVLMDCDMPRMDGWETARRIRSWSTDVNEKLRQAASLPIIALTAVALPEERNRCFEAGMSDFVAKPVNLRSLRRSLEAFARVPA